MDAQAALKQAEKRLLSLPNIRGVVISEKAGKPVIKVFVTHKVPKNELQPQEIIPKKIAGYPTDVEEIGDVSAQLNENLNRTR